MICHIISPHHSVFVMQINETKLISYQWEIDTNCMNQNFHHNQNDCKVGNNHIYYIN